MEDLASIVDMIWFTPIKFDETNVPLTEQEYVIQLLHSIHGNVLCVLEYIDPLNLNVSVCHLCGNIGAVPIVISMEEEIYKYYICDQSGRHYHDIERYYGNFDADLRELGYHYIRPWATYYRYQHTDGHIIRVHERNVITKKEQLDAMHQYRQAQLRR